MLFREYGGSKIFGFGKDERIRKTNDFTKVKESGKRIGSKNFTVIYRKNEKEISRLGIGVSKKLGSAVKRNRMKRLVREFFRLSKGSIPRGYDFLVILKNDISHLGFKEVEKELGGLFFGKIQ